MQQFRIQYIAVLFCFLIFSCNNKFNRLVVSSSSELKLALKHLQDGDTLIINDGIYNVNIFNEFPVGNKKWNVIKARNAGKVVFRPFNGGRVLHFGAIRGRPISFIEINGIVLDGRHVESDVVKITKGAHHIRIINCDIINGNNQGVLIADHTSCYNEIRNCRIYNNGKDIYHHGLYISSSYNIVDSCLIYDNSCCGINLYNGKGLKVDNNIISNNYIYDNARIVERGTGITVYGGSKNVVKSNIVTQNNHGIRVDYGSTNNIVEGNILFDNKYTDLLIGQKSSKTQVLKNQLFEYEDRVRVRLDGINKSLNLKDQIAPINLAKRKSIKNKLDSLNLKRY